MSALARTRSEGRREPPRSAGLLESIRSYFTGRDHLRRGICLLSAGAYDGAIAEFALAAKANPGNRSLAGHLAAAHAGNGQFGEAAAHWASLLQSGDGDELTRVRHGLALWKSGRAEDALTSLREAVRELPESAEVHFQLGNMLAERDELDEAELRFTAAVTLNRAHAEAWVALAMCHGAKGDHASSVHCLHKAQRWRPDDPRVAMLLAYALKSAHPSGTAPARAPLMPADDTAEDERDIAALSTIVEREPDFVEAVLSIDADEVRPEVFALLADTLRVALERHPEHADLHYHCGCVLARLGRTGEAIASIERAVGLRPRFVKALIQLARLYGESDRNLDARQRLEEAIRQGAEYADVYFLLGNMYRDGGMTDRAQVAYRQALRINPSYQAAREALAVVGA